MIGEEKELLSSDLRAALLNDINKLMVEKGYGLVACGYEDLDGELLTVIFMKEA